MTEEIRVFQAEMPARIRGYTVYKDGYYTIIINSILDRSQQIKEYEHELKHIARQDHESALPADMIEIECHKGG
jgi:Zn-dependent peptidase ImmA (M78 family)